MIINNNRKRQLPTFLTKGQCVIYCPQCEHKHNSKVVITLCHTFEVKSTLFCYAVHIFTSGYGSSVDNKITKTKKSFEDVHCLLNEFVLNFIKHSNFGSQDFMIVEKWRTGFHHFVMNFLFNNH